MDFTRRFRALGRVSAFFGVAWGMLGTALEVLLGGPLLGSLLHFGVMFGAVGTLSGILTGLVLARGEAGHTVADLPTWRSVAWGFLCGFAPAVVMLGIIAALGPTPGVAVPLLSVGSVSGGATAAVAAWISRDAKRTELREARPESRALSR